jgi:carboxylesterase type B
MSIKIISVLAILNFCALLKCEMIEIDDGKLEGTVLKTRKGLDVYAFLKIPFAEPPIGKLRFQPPIPHKKWEGILNAKQFGPACMQNYDGPDGDLSEDCLQLNVFTKELNSVDLKPTIVYIHGGVRSN